MFCIQCGKKMPAHAKFCANCGAKLLTSENQPSLPPAAEPADTPPPIVPPAPPERMHEGFRNNGPSVQTPVFKAVGLCRHADAGEGGGAFWYTLAIIQLLRDRLKVTDLMVKTDSDEEPEVLRLLAAGGEPEMPQTVIPGSNIKTVAFSEIAGAALTIGDDDDIGMVLVRYKKKGFLDYITKAFPVKIYFRSENTEQFSELATTINAIANQAL